MFLPRRVPPCTGLDRDVLITDQPEVYALDLARRLFVVGERPAMDNRTLSTSEIMQGVAHELTQMAQPLRNRQGERDIWWLRLRGDVVSQAPHRGRAFQVLMQVVYLRWVSEP